MTQIEIMLKLRDSIQGHAILNEMTLDVMPPVEIRERHYCEALRFLQPFLFLAEKSTGGKKQGQLFFLDSAGTRH